MRGGSRSNPLQSNFVPAGGAESSAVPEEASAATSRGSRIHIVMPAEKDPSQATGLAERAGFRQPLPLSVRPANARIFQQQIQQHQRHQRRDKLDAIDSARTAATSAAATATTAVPPAGTAEASSRRTQRKQYFDEHLPKEEALRLIAEGKLLQAELRINRLQRSLAYATVPGFERDVLIDGDRMRNRALDGDLVALELIPQDAVKTVIRQERRSSKKERAVRSRQQTQSSVAGSKVGEDSILLLPGDGDGGEAVPYATGAADAVVEELEDIEDEEAQAKRGARRLCRVVCILNDSKSEAARENMCGTLAPMSPRSSTFLFTPLDQKLPRCLVPNPGRALQQQQQQQLAPGATDNKLYMASMKPGSWTSQRLYPTATISRELGLVGNVRAETEAILRSLSIEFDEFPAAVLDELHSYSKDWTIPESEIARRRDLRHRRIFTIDPTTARDLDDALCIERVPGTDDLVEIIVSIADVSHFVQPNSPLDVHARTRRCTSVYLVQNVVPMLPSVLSEHLCSLNPGVDRLAFSCGFQMNMNTGEVLYDDPSKIWFCKTVIRSRAKLDYDTVQRIITGEDQTLAGIDADVKSDCRLMHKVAMLRRRHRYDVDGAMSLHRPKMYFHLSKGDADGLPVPTGCGLYITREANWLVEEFMLLANELVARQITNSAATGLSLSYATLRWHPPPKADKLQEFVTFCEEKLGMAIDVSSSGSFFRSLKQAGATGAEKIPVQARVLEHLATKTMCIAQYFVASAQETWRHYALAMDAYTHFTSPIRRYADILVHRALLASLRLPEDPAAADDLLDGDALAATAGLCNEKKLTARKAEEKSQHLFLVLLLSRQPRLLSAVEAVVYEVGPRYMRVLELAHGIEGEIHYHNIQRLCCGSDGLARAVKCKHDAQTNCLLVYVREQEQEREREEATHQEPTAANEGTSLAKRKEGKKQRGDGALGGWRLAHTVGIFSLVTVEIVRKANTVPISLLCRMVGLPAEPSQGND